ncbi:MAG: putative Ntn-hydrolase superfamily protein, partial [Pirellulaceae bacterium]
MNISWTAHSLIWVAAVIVLAPNSLMAQSKRAAKDWPTIATFSIIALDEKTGELGGAVQSRVFGVGNGVLWAEAGIGIVATQAMVDVSYGPKSLTLLREGKKPTEIVKTIWDSDVNPLPTSWPKSGRQFAVMNNKGEHAIYTGPTTSKWSGHKGATHVIAQGNILAKQEVVDDMVKAFQEAEGHLSLRLVAALEAGQKAGGDIRGMQSAAILIVKKNGGPWLNNDTVMRLQVD